MSKDKITDYAASAAANTDIGGVSIAEGCAYGNMNDAVRMMAKHLADMNAGTHPLADTVTFGDPADLTKRYRLDAGSITTGTTRVITVPDATGTMVLTAGAQALQSKTFADASDATKVLAFNLANIATATTRTVTWPNASGIVMLADLYPTANSLDGLILAAGDTLYATAENTLQKLAKGTDGQILKIGASAPSWIDDPALVRIASQTATGAGIAFTGLAGYAYIEIVFDSVVFSGVNDPYIRLSTDNGATYVSAAGAYDGVAANDATGTDSDTEIRLFDGSTIGALDGRICLSFFNNATEKTVVDGHTRVGTLMCVVSARRDVAEINNAVSFFASTGTMSSGTVTLWGRKR